MEARASGVRWDLSALYSSPQDPKIEENWKRLGEEAEAFAEKWKGRVETGELSPGDLAGAIFQLEKIANEANKAPTYAHLLFEADTSDPALGAFMQAQMEKASALRVRLMFFELELQAAPGEWLQQCIDSDELASYRHYLVNERKYAPYRLSEKEEVLLEETANVGSRAWVRLHTELTSNQRFPYVDPESGEVEMLSLEETTTKLRHENRDVRQAAADAMTAGLAELQRTIVFTYNTLLADKSLEDRLRSFEHPERSRHLNNELDKETVDLVMDLCRENSGMVADYYRVKQSILGLDELTHVDRYAPLFEDKGTVPWELGQKIVVDSFGQFSSVLAERAKEFFDENWIDAEPRDGKSGGAFCSYNTPDTHPVVMMSYMGQADDVMTLAHELGHGAHASLSREQSLFNFHGTLPLAELASIFGEMLVFERLVKEATLKEKLALYAEKIEGIFASVHRQSAMFRFEQRCHQIRRESGELTPEQFGEIWQDEMQSMFEDAVKLGDQHRLWWLYVGHFFFAPFYVYAYSFGELLTLSLYERAKEEGPEFAEKYIQVLRLGGSKTPHELMEIVGVDLRDKAFWEGGFAVINRMVDTFGSLWKEYS